MSDEDLKKIDELLEKQNQPLHRELSRITKELKEVKGYAAMNTLEISSLKKDHASIESNLTTLQESADALTADMYQVQQKVGATYDLVKLIKEKHEEEFDEIREHTGIPPAKREPLKFAE